MTLDALEYLHLTHQFAVYEDAYLLIRILCLVHDCCFGNLGWIIGRQGPLLSLTSLPEKVPLEIDL